MLKTTQYLLYYIQNSLLSKRVKSIYLKRGHVIFRTKAIFLVAFLMAGFGTYAQDLTLSEKMVERFAGPFHFRFILQPLMAIILGFKDGRTDVALNRPPFILYIFGIIGDRKGKIRNMFKSISKVLTVAFILDVLAQLFLFRSVRILDALLVAGLIIAPPYILARGIANHLLRRLTKRTSGKEMDHHSD